LIARQPYQLRLKNLLSRKVFKENNLIDCKTTISITAENLLSRKVFKENNLIDCKTTISITAEKSLKQKKFSKKTTRLIENQEECKTTC
jgi:hypothetical protein